MAELAGEVLALPGGWPADDERVRLSANAPTRGREGDAPVKDLTGKTAFVTGAASGIGLGVATALAQAGAKVMLCDIEQAARDQAVAALKLTNADVEGVQADVSLRSQLQAAAEAVIARYGKVHIVVNNAGVAGGGAYGAWSDASWNWTIGVNLLAVIWGVEIFGPLIEGHGEGGHIVNTASIAGLISGSGTPYNVTKYGVVALSEGLRNDLAPRGIGVSVLCPGFIRTHIVDSRRNLPERFADEGLAPGPSGAVFSEALRRIRERVDSGIDPLYVGELVREAIENDWAYVFTDTEFEPFIEARFAGIKRGFDQIRGREPRR
jgi:NAD(P)-dependent dehydrogenase (short-subunit alcohol dehydrogenase family)